MADYNILSSSEEFLYKFSRAAMPLRVAQPGIILEFFPETQTATVQPAIKMRVGIAENGGELALPPILNVPVVLPFAQTAGLLLTLPIQAGDECLLVFADRAIDTFLERGGLQATPAPINPETILARSHNLTDAICIPGIISNPQAVPEYNTENIEIRDRERKHYLSLGPDGITITDGSAVWHMAEGKVLCSAPSGITQTDEKATWTMEGGKVTTDAPTGITETSQGSMERITPACQTIKGSNINIDCAAKTNRMSGKFEIGDPGVRSVIHGDVSMPEGTVTDKDGVVLNTHTHRGVMTGPGNTDEPVKG